MDANLLARLREPDCYPGQPASVELRQTHMSVVCLAGDRVYKLKKPVKFSFADFSTQGAREKFCREELRLNRRLCPDMYLDVVPLRRTADGSWSFREDKGEIVDHAVLMRRLPEERQMDRLLENNAVTESQVAEVARIMARFHRDSKIEQEAQEAGSPENQREAILDNFTATGPFADEVFDGELLEAVKARALTDLERFMPLLEKRVHRGCVVEGHGDLHARNICLTDPPTVFDCLEFSREFRCGDVAVENAFLVMDLIYRGKPDLARVYLDTYIEETGDEEQRRLMPLFVSYRAMVRAKVAALTTADEDIDDKERRRARDAARHYLQLAATASLTSEPLLLIFFGLPAAGKSTLSRALSQRSGWPAYSSDSIRKELAGTDPNERLPQHFYRPDFSRRVYDTLIERACQRIGKSPVIADANFPTKKRRSQIARAAIERGGRPVFIWINADESVIVKRLERRVEGGEDTHGSDADLDVYRKLAESFERPDAGEDFPLITVQGDVSVEDCLERVLVSLLTSERADN